MSRKDNSVTAATVARCGLFLLVVLCGRFTAAQEQDAPKLRYGWKAGQTVVYSVTIEADRGDYADILHGQPSYTVKSVDEDGITVSFRGTLSQSQKAHPGKRLIFRGLRRFSRFSPFSGVSGPGRVGGNELTINRHGEVVSSRGSSQLPFLLGNLSQLMIERLPEAGGKTWKHTRQISISESSSRIPLPSILRRNNQKITKATEETVYTIDKMSADSVDIKKSYELKSAATIGGDPKFQITGEGKLTFDLKLGVFSRLEYEQSIIVRDKNNITVTPVKVSFRLLTDAERKKNAAALAANRAKAAAPLNADERQQLLADLKSNQQARFLKRLIQLQQKSPAEPDEETARAIEPYLSHANISIRFYASRALTNWATQKSVPVLLKSLDDKSPIVRGAAMQTLARLGAKEAVQPIADMLADRQGRVGASKALQAMGPIAEEAVLKQLKNDEWIVRHEACKVLGAIGTAKGVKLLKKLEADPNLLVRRSAKQAIQKIEKRKTTGKPAAST